MNKKIYKSNIPGKNFICKRGEYVIKQKEYVGNNMKARGIWYDIENRTVYFSSDSMADIVASTEFKVWQHTCFPDRKKIKECKKVVIIPNVEAIKQAKQDNVPICSVEFDYVGNITKVTKLTRKSWPSQNK